MRGVTAGGGAADRGRGGRRAGPGRRAGLTATDRRCGSPTRGYGLLAAGVLLLAAGFWFGYPELAALGSAAVVAVLGALGVRGLAAAADRRAGRSTRTGSCAASPAGCTLEVANASRFFGASLVARDRLMPGAGGGGTVPVPLVRLRPGRVTTRRATRCRPGGAGSSTSARWRSAGATRSPWSGWCAGTAGTTKVWVRPAGAPHRLGAGRAVAQHGRPGRPGTARQHHLRRPARVRDRRRPAARALADLGPGRRADGARARRHQPAAGRDPARRPGRGARARRPTASPPSRPPARRPPRCWWPRFREDIHVELQLVSGAAAAVGRTHEVGPHAGPAGRGEPGTGADAGPGSAALGHGAAAGTAARRHPALPDRAAQRGGPRHGGRPARARTRRSSPGCSVRWRAASPPPPACSWSARSTARTSPPSGTECRHGERWPARAGSACRWSWWP